MSVLRNIRFETPAFLVTKWRQILELVNCSDYITIMSWQPFVNTAWYLAVIRLSMRNYFKPNQPWWAITKEPSQKTKNEYSVRSPKLIDWTRIWLELAELKTWNAASKQESQESSSQIWRSVMFYISSTFCTKYFLDV